MNDPKYYKGDTVVVINPDAGEIFFNKPCRVALVPRFKSPRGKLNGWWYTVDVIALPKGLRQARQEIHESGLGDAA